MTLPPAPLDPPLPSPSPLPVSAPDDLHLPGWSDLTATPPDRRVLVAVAVAALATDLALRSGVTGLAGGLLTAVVAGGALSCGRVPNRRAWPVLAVAPLFGMWLAVRASPWLLPFDVLAAACLLVLGASLSREGDPSDLTIPGLVGRALHALTHGCMAPGFLMAGARPRSGRGGDRFRGTSPQAASIARGALLAAPLVCLLAVLLSSADPVFASFFRLPTNAGDVMLHGLFLVVGCWGAAGLLRMASATPFTMPAPPRRPLGSVEATTILGGLVILFAAFTVAQLLAVVRGADYVVRTAGLSYAEYARTGFFQLLAVAALSLGIVLAVRATAALTTPADRRRFLILAEIVVVLTLVIVAGAIRRLALYEQAYGLTMLRLGCLAFALWIGAVFVLLGVALTGAGRPRAWLAPAAAGLALAGLLAMNVINPEALVVRRNVDRFASSDKVDASYLASLSDDVVPTLLQALPRLDRESVQLVLERVCAGERRGGGGFWSYNASREKAASACRNQS